MDECIPYADCRKWSLAEIASEPGNARYFPSNDAFELIKGTFRGEPSSQQILEVIAGLRVITLGNQSNCLQMTSDLMKEFTQLVPILGAFGLFNEFHAGFRSQYKGMIVCTDLPIEMAMICWRMQKSCSAAAYLFEIVYHEDRGKLAGLDLWHLLKAANATHSEVINYLLTTS